MSEVFQIKGSKNGENLWESKSNIQTNWSQPEAHVKKKSKPNGKYIQQSISNMRKVVDYGTLKYEPIDLEAAVKIDLEQF